MWNNPNEENHFLRGDRTLTLTDVRLAKQYGPILIAIAKGQKPKSFRQFIKIAKANYPNSKVISNAIPVSTGRRFEAFRLYLKVYSLRDPSAWITDLAGNNSSEYETDFFAPDERIKSAQFDWSPYVPGKSLVGIKIYTDFFRDLDAYARLREKQRNLTNLVRICAKHSILRQVYEDPSILPKADKETFNKVIGQRMTTLITRTLLGDKLKDLI